MTLLYFVVGTAILAYLGLPLVIKSTLKINARPGLTPVTPSYLSDDVQEYLAACAPKLSALKFEQANVFTVEQATQGVTSHVALWVNRAAGQAAAVTVMIASKGEKPNQVKRYVEFLTRVPDGVSVATNNSPDLGAFKKTAGSDTLSATRLQDLSHLYRLHLWREGQIAGMTAPRELPAPGAELKWFADLFEESIKRQVGTGYLQRVSGDATLYVPSMQGAYLMTWAELPPMKSMRRGAEDKRAASQIRQAAKLPASAPPPAAVRLADAGADRGPTRRAA